MEESTKLAERVAREIAASSTISRTPPGPSDVYPRPPAAQVEAINQVFALFRLNYHNQYYAAFSDAEQLRQIKKLWLESLRTFPPVQILQGARQAINSSEYLPTLNRMRSCCEESLPALGLPGAHDAYLEAAGSTQPPEAHHWSDPLVYWAGRDCGFAFLASSTERAGWPVFRERYHARCSTFLECGHCDPVPPPPANRLPARALDRDAALAAIDRLRANNDL